MGKIEAGGSVQQTTRTNLVQDETNAAVRSAKTPVKYDNDNTFGHIVDTVVKAAQTAVKTATAAALKPTDPAAPQQNISYDRFDKTLDYMFNEMKTNIGSDTVKNIKSQLDYADHLMHPKSTWERILNGLGGANPADHINSALISWGLKVRPGGDWDHKPKLDKMLDLGKDKDYYFPIRGDDKHEVFYDIWSNIHYGYVGSAAGFDGKTLQDGASVADGIAGRNDKVDEVTVQIGIDMWNKYGANLTKEQFHQEILNRLPDIIKAQESQDSHQVIPITNGR